MGNTVQFNPEKFSEFFGENLMMVKGATQMLQSMNDPKEACGIEVLKQYAAYMEAIIASAQNGNKFLWHGFVFSPEIFYGFEGVQPYCLEFPCFILSSLNPQGIHKFIDLTEHLWLPPEICPLDKGFLGATLEGVQPPAGITIAHTTPCDSASTAYQILETLIDAPVVYCDMPYATDKEGIDLYSRYVRHAIETTEEVLGVKMDWDKCREHVLLANEITEYILAEMEMCKLSPCPHHGRLNTGKTFLYMHASGMKGSRDAARFILEDSKRLAAEKKGALEDERIRVLWYNPDPFHDMTIHDWMEETFGAITVLSLGGHIPPNMIDTSTPETIVRDYAHKMMNQTMTRHYRGPHEYFVDEMISAIEDWNVDAVVVPALPQCKHGQGAHGFVTQACKERDIPLLLLEYDVLDSRGSFPDLRQTLKEFMETQVLTR